jgi:hypothetical protein
MAARRKINQRLIGIIEKEGFGFAAYVNNFENRSAKIGSEKIRAPQLSFIVWNEDDVTNLLDPKLYPDIKGKPKASKGDRIVGAASAAIATQMGVKPEDLQGGVEPPTASAAGYYRDEKGKLLYFDGKNYQSVAKGAKAADATPEVGYYQDGDGNTLYFDGKDYQEVKRG